MPARTAARRNLAESKPKLSGPHRRAQEHDYLCWIDLPEPPLAPSTQDGTTAQRCRACTMLGGRAHPSSVDPPLPPPPASRRRDQPPRSSHTSPDRASSPPSAAQKSTRSGQSQPARRLTHQIRAPLQQPTQARSVGHHAQAGADTQQIRAGNDRRRNMRAPTRRPGRAYHPRAASARAQPSLAAPRRPPPSRDWTRWA